MKWNTTDFKKFLCIWLLSLNIVFLKPIHMQCVSSDVYCLFYGHRKFVSTLFCGLVLVVFSTFSYYLNCCYESLCLSLCVDMFSLFLQQNWVIWKYVFKFLEKNPFSNVDCSILHSLLQYKQVELFHILNTCYQRSLIFGHSIMYVIESQCGFKIYLFYVKKLWIHRVL